MHIIKFITGNSGKVASLERYIDTHKFSIEQHDTPLIEPQLDDIEAIAISKATQAFEQMKSPVLVQDSGFYIETLNGFPGPYVKYVVETAGIDPIIRMMAGQENRKCKFIGIIAYANENGHITTFKDESAFGTIAIEKDTSPLRSDAWSSLWRIFTPHGFDVPLNKMNDKQHQTWHDSRDNNNNFQDFASWLSNQPV